MVFNDGYCECGSLMALTTDAFPISSWSCPNRQCKNYNKPFYKPHNMLQLFTELGAAQVAYNNLDKMQGRLI